MYQAASGDCTIVARVTGVENTDASAKVGVMIRTTLNTDSMYALLSVKPNGGLEFLRRTTAGGSTSVTSASSTLPRWVRLVRSGNTLTASHSSDGSTWTTVGSETITMGTNVYIGMAVNSHNDGTLCTGTFTNVTATP